MRAPALVGLAVSVSSSSTSKPFSAATGAVGFVGGEAVLENILKDRRVDAAINGSFVCLGFVLEDAGHYAASSV